MMQARCTVASSETELFGLYHRASHMARILLNSDEKHGDLPLIMRAHACMVLGCSDEDGCYERMEEALALIKQAVEERCLGQTDGEMMIKSCEVIMGLRGQALTESDEEQSEGSGDESEDIEVSNGKGESDENEESKDEGAGGDEGCEKNDALP
jgi:hypothetical protein